MKKLALILVLLFVALCPTANADKLQQSFRCPPESAKPWVYWFWMNGNVTREGITKDLEAMKKVGIGGVLWMEVSGQWWAPQGPIESGGKEWHEMMQWAISEADRLGISFAMTVDFGYCCGGPHITPDLSMQELLRSETKIRGGKPVTIKLKKPVVDYTDAVKNACLRPGTTMNPVVTDALKKIDSYKDVAIFAVPASENDASKIKDLGLFDGRKWETELPPLRGKSKLAALDRDKIINLTDKVTDDGTLRWDAPEGDWTVIRLGQASNFRMTRPCPHSAVGLECDRMNSRGIDAHFQHLIKPILDAAGEKAGRTLKYIHVDSWEAGGQNWSKGFADEFRRRRGYDIEPWLPVLAGHAVENAEASRRFLWDMRQTVSEVTLAAFIDRLRELVTPYGVKFSCEPYGWFCVDQLSYGGHADFPIAEFWTEIEFKKRFPTFYSHYYSSMKGVASVANTYGKKLTGAESFTGSRGWIDHPYLLKGMGDVAFSNGINHYIIHLSAHQPYDNMVPGLTHRRWGQHFNRHQTWWNFSRPYFDYVARSQTLLRQGHRAVDVACLYHEGAPIHMNDLKFKLPSGYDFDYCSSEIIQRMKLRDGRIHLPNGVSYRYLVLPRSGELTLPTTQKIAELQEAGAEVYLQSPINGTPGLVGYPKADQQVKNITAKWPLLPEGGWDAVFAADHYEPDFQGEGLNYTHRHTDDADLYFVANTKPESTQRECSFRITGKMPELWDPESGKIYALPKSEQVGGRTSVTLDFQPSQSWFVVFRDQPTDGRCDVDPFATTQPIQKITGPWNLSFDPDWGRQEPITLDRLSSWSEHADPLVKYYSGTAIYHKTFDVSESDLANGKPQFLLDLGQVEVMARVKLNGKPCGITWKPPYRVDITHAIQPGKNTLEIAVVNTWVNRMIGDEQLPLATKWKDFETLLEWPDWFKQNRPNPTGRYTFTTARHYKKQSSLLLSGLLGPVQILKKNDNTTH